MQITDKNIGKYLEWWHHERHLARTDLLWLSNKVLGYPDVIGEGTWADSGGVAEVSRSE